MKTNQSWDTIPLQPLSFSFTVGVFRPFSSTELISSPKLSVSDLSSAKCVGQSTIRFLLPHSCSTTSANSNSNHFARHQRSFGNMVGWAASCSGGICWAPDINDLGTHKKTTGEEKRKLLDDLQTAEWRRIVFKDFWIESFSADASTSKYQRSVQKRQQINKMTSISQTSICVFTQNTIDASLPPSVKLFQSGICEFMVNTHSTHFFPPPVLLCSISLKHSQPNSRLYWPRIYCLSCNFLPQELERLPFILKDRTLLH